LRCITAALRCTVLHCTAGCRERYEKAITHGSDKHATQYERERGALAAGCLRQETGPYMLRREKKEVFQTAGDAPAGGAAEGEAAPAGVPTAAGEAAAAAAGAGGGGGAKPAAMPHKNDLIVWLKLQPMQRKVYQAFLNSGGWGAGCRWVLVLGRAVPLCISHFIACSYTPMAEPELPCPPPALLAHHLPTHPPAHHLQTL
jgi:hypothetical protein